MLDYVIMSTGPSDLWDILTNLTPLRTTISFHSITVEKVYRNKFIDLKGAHKKIV